jgi:hypothetical protein
VTWKSALRVTSGESPWIAAAGLGPPLKGKF